MRISLIVAVADNGVIGREGELPWRLPADLRRFKRLTLGHHLLVGRKTFESIGRPLPGRQMVVLSRSTDYRPEQVAVVPSLEAALELARSAGEEELFVGGGEQIYRLALPRVERIYRTRVHAEVEGDAFFPSLQAGEWSVTVSAEYPADERNSHRTTFEVLDRASRTLPLISSPKPK